MIALNAQVIGSRPVASFIEKSRLPRIFPEAFFVFLIDTYTYKTGPKNQAALFCMKFSPSCRSFFMIGNVQTIFSMNSSRASLFLQGVHFGMEAGITRITENHYREVITGADFCRCGCPKANNVM